MKSLNGGRLVLSRHVLKRNLNMLLAKVHLSRESGVWLPLARGAGSRLLQHLVDLLEGKTLGLGDEEVGEYEGNAAESAPHEEDVGAETGRVGAVGDEVGGDDTDDAVPEPVRGSGETDTTRADGEREDLADDDPGARSPGGSEDGDVQADERNHGADSVGVGVGGVSVLASGGTNDPDDELHDDHTSGTEDEDGTTSNLLDHDEGSRGGEHVDEGGDHGDQEGVVDRAELLEEDGAEVEDEVDTSKLLHHLDEDTDKGTASVGRRLGDAALEASCPGADVAGLGNNGHLVLVVGNDLSKLVLDVLRVDGLATDTAESGGSLVELSLLDVETRGLGEESKTGGEDDGPQELDGDRDTVRSSIAAVLGGVDDAVGEQNTDGDAELVTSNNGTTDLLGGDLGHVQNDDGGDETDTETSDETTSSHHTETSGGSLEDTTNAEDGTTEDDGDTATDEVGDVTSHDGTEESTSGRMEVTRETWLDLTEKVELR